MPAEQSETPVWLFTLIAEQDPRAWRALAGAVPDLGRYSLRPEVQQRVKRLFARRVVTPQSRTAEQRAWVLPNGALHGPEEWWCAGKSGALYLQSKCDFVNGAPEGARECYYEDGSLEDRRTFSRGRENGLAQAWHPNGQLRMQCTYVNGVLSGEKEHWDAYGHATWRMAYVDGQEVACVARG